MKMIMSSTGKFSGRCTTLKLALDHQVFQVMFSNTNNQNITTYRRWAWGPCGKPQIRKNCQSWTFPNLDDVCMMTVLLHHRLGMVSVHSFKWMANELWQMWYTFWTDVLFANMIIKYAYSLSNTILNDLATFVLWWPSWKPSWIFVKHNPTINL